MDVFITWRHRSAQCWTCNELIFFILFTTLKIVQLRLPQSTPPSTLNVEHSPPPWYRVLFCCHLCHVLTHKHGLFGMFIACTQIAAPSGSLPDFIVVGRCRRWMRCGADGTLPLCRRHPILDLTSSLVFVHHCYIHELCTVISLGRKMKSGRAQIRKGSELWVGRRAIDTPTPARFFPFLSQSLFWYWCAQIGADALLEAAANCFHVCVFCIFLFVCSVFSVLSCPVLSCPVLFCTLYLI